ncbi:hypothetical protein [Pseudophaeobacter sp.]|uniref:hypothetical protein n=1 Tax=Pseudophaeobacter sp. TaxID=1971739 RepID=UPI0032981976
MFVSYDLRETKRFPACRGADHIRLSDQLHAALDPGQGLISARRGRAVDLRFSDVSPEAQWLELALKLRAPGHRGMGHRGMGPETRSGKGPGRRPDRGALWHRCSRFFCRLKLALQPAPAPAAEGALSEGPPPEKFLPERDPPERDPPEGELIETRARVLSPFEGQPDTRPDTRPEIQPEIQSEILPKARLALRLHHRDGFEDVFVAAPLLLQPQLSWQAVEITPPLHLVLQAEAVDLHLFLPPADGALQLSDFAVTGVL